MRVTADAIQLFQQHIGHAILVHALHHHVNVRGGEDAVLLGLEALRRDVDQLAGVADVYKRQLVFYHRTAQLVKGFSGVGRLKFSSFPEGGEPLHCLLYTSRCV